MSTLVEPNSMRVEIASELSPDLAFRENARAFCNRLESYPMNSISIDFSGTVSITRSFAQEYISYKSRTSKEIHDVNVPDNILKMFRIVEKQGEKRTVVNPDKIRIICI